VVGRRIRQIRAAGRDPQIEVLAHGLPNADAALRVEAAVIDALGLTGLSNRVRGVVPSRGGRAGLPELIARYTRRRATIREPAILIRINQEYRHGMSDAELYDATRGVWVLGEKRDEAEFALAVFEGVVREVYRITEWLAAGSTFNSRWNGRAIRAARRFEFVGVIASERVRKRYVDRWVGHLFAKGAQNPITYVNIG
jgi:uncharacterized protein